MAGQSLFHNPPFEYWPGTHMTCGIASPPRARRYAVTLFIEDGQTLDTAAVALARVVAISPRCVYQLEVTPTTERQHYQCYFEFSNARLVSAVPQLFAPFHPHVTVATGTAQENHVYCTKLDTRAPGAVPFVKGDFTIVAGARTDIAAAAATARTGTRDGDSADFIDLDAELQQENLYASVAHVLPGPFRLSEVYRN